LSVGISSFVILNALLHVVLYGLTSSWNSQENPSKVHIFNRRIHHGEIGTLLGLSNLYTKYPIPTGILAGIGSGLVKDDHDDMKEWFTFKKKK
jgi:hypothetical protein